MFLDLLSESQELDATIKLTCALDSEILVGIEELKDKISQLGNSHMENIIGESNSH